MPQLTPKTGMQCVFLSEFLKDKRLLHRLVERGSLVLSVVTSVARPVHVRPLLECLYQRNISTSLPSAQ